MLIIIYRSRRRDKWKCVYMWLSALLVTTDEITKCLYVGILIDWFGNFLYDKYKYSILCFAVLYSRKERCDLGNVNISTQIDGDLVPSSQLINILHLSKYVHICMYTRN